MSACLKIANARGVPGTAGAFLNDADGARYLLAAHHVVFGSGASVGDKVWALPPGDVAPSEVVEVGRAVRGEIGRAGAGDAISFVDCALVAIKRASEREAWPEWLSQTFAKLPSTAKPAAARRGGQVRKVGATTGATIGLVVDDGYDDQPLIGGRSWTASRQLLVRSLDPALDFSGPGDSGAVVFDEADRAVGLLWGTSAGGQGLASPMCLVLEVLGMGFDLTEGHSP